MRKMIALTLITVLAIPCGSLSGRGFWTETGSGSPKSRDSTYTSGTFGPFGAFGSYIIASNSSACGADCEAYSSVSCIPNTTGGYSGSAPSVNANGSESLGEDWTPQPCDDGDQESQYHEAPTDAKVVVDVSGEIGVSVLLDTTINNLLVSGTASTTGRAEITGHNAANEINLLLYGTCGLTGTALAGGMSVSLSPSGPSITLSPVKIGPNTFSLEDTRSTGYQKTVNGVVGEISSATSQATASASITTAICATISTSTKFTQTSTLQFGGTHGSGCPCNTKPHKH